MKFIKTAFEKFISLIFSRRRRSVAQIALDQDGNSPFVFQLSNLIFIGYDENSRKITLVLKGRAPVFLPLTAGNLEYLLAMAPYFASKVKNDAKVATDEFGASKSSLKPKGY